MSYDLDKLDYKEITGTANVEVKRIETYIDQYGYTKPILHIAPKLRIGDHEITTIELQTWDNITDTNIYPGCTIECKYGYNWCKISPSSISVESIKKSNAVIANISCPVCWHGKIVSDSPLKRCSNPYCHRHVIIAIWRFLRLGLRMGNLPYQSIYNLYRFGKLRQFDMLWKLTDSDLAIIGLKEQDIDNFRLRLANASELRLDMLIYFLGLDGLKVSDALDIARKIVKPSDTEYTEYVDTNRLFDPVNMMRPVEAEDINGETRRWRAKDMPVCTWRHYVIHSRKELSSIFNSLKIARPKVRYSCAGFSFVIGDTGKISKEDVTDLIALNDGNVISSTQDIRWSMVSYFVTVNTFSDDYLLRCAKHAKVSIITFQELETLFGIKVPDTEITFNAIDDISISDNDL